LYSAAPAAANPPEVGGKSAQAKIPEQQGVQVSDQAVDEFKPYSGSQNKKTQNGEKSPSGASPTQDPEQKQNPQVQAAVEKLKSIEEKVKAHEAAHKSGGAATGPVSYTYTRGPDGKNYITGGEVPITISTGQTPEETINRMQLVIQAALAPADPSPQDRAVAAQASTIQQAARQEKASASQQPGQEGAPDVPAASQSQAAGSIATRDAQRAYGSPAVAGESSGQRGANDVVSPRSQGATGSRTETTGMTPAGITGFGSSRPMSYYA
jgi:hypothetical protein